MTIRRKNINSFVINRNCWIWNVYTNSIILNKIYLDTTLALLETKRILYSFNSLLNYTLRTVFAPIHICPRFSDYLRHSSAASPLDAFCRGKVFILIGGKLFCRGDQRQMACVIRLLHISRTIENSWLLNQQWVSPSTQSKPFGHSCNLFLAPNPTHVCTEKTRIGTNSFMCK